MTSLHLALLLAPQLIAPGTWTLFVFVILAVFGVLAFFSLRRHVRRIPPDETVRDPRLPDD